MNGGMSVRFSAACPSSCCSVRRFRHRQDHLLHAGLHWAATSSRSLSCAMVLIPSCLSAALLDIAITGF
jgi:hypothetical protein